MREKCASSADRTNKQNLSVDNKIHRSNDNNK